MSTRVSTRAAAAAGDELAEVAEQATDPRAARAAQVNARTHKLYEKAAQREMRKAPRERRSERILWREARKQAEREVRGEAVRGWVRDHTKSAVTTVTADVRTAVHRNRRQLVPWMIAAPFAVLGLLANLACTQGSANPVAVAVTAAALAAVGAWWAWSKGAGARFPALTTRVPTPFRAKVQAGLGVGTIFVALMPFTPWTDWMAGPWLLLVFGTFWLSLSWWRHVDHPIPGTPSKNTEPAGEVELPTTNGTYGREVIAAWQTYVADTGILRGATLSHAERTEFGWQWRINLVRGSQTIDDARNALVKIAAALDVPAPTVTIDQDPRPGATQTSGRLQIITDKPVNAYEGPRIVREGGDVYIEIGPYEDGQGCERFHVLSDQLTDDELAAGEKPRGSIFGGFVLGSKGAGKSRLLEQIADGLRELGIIVVYLDPQEGKSSPALMAEADMPLSGVHSVKGSYGNVLDLLHLIRSVCEYREAAYADQPGFQHSPEHPGIVAIIDECHAVFKEDNPETGVSFGAEFAQLDRIMRKNGVGLLGASQAITQDTFGKGNLAGVLRDGMCQENVFLMAYSNKNLNLVPNYQQQPAASLPINRGYGYNTKGERPHVRWQARYTPDYQSHLAAKPKPELEPDLAKWVGPVWTDRFTTAEANVEALRAFVEQIRAWDGNPATRPVRPGTGSTDNTTKGQPTSAAQRGSVATVTVLSPHQRRAAQAHAEDTDDLTDGQRRVLDALDTNGGARTAQAVADTLGISRQAASNHLKALVDKKVVVRTEDGRWMRHTH